MRKLKKGFNALLVLATALHLISAHATLSSVDFVAGSGDNWLTRDSVTGLEWLDVPLTANQSFSQVLASSWYASGFRYATKAELSALFTNAGTPDDNGNNTITYPTATLALANLLGPTLVVNASFHRVATHGLLATTQQGSDIDPENYPVGGFHALIGKIEYLNIPGVLSHGEAHFAGVQAHSEEASPRYGSYLVRAYSVPESGTGFLFGLGITLLAISSYARWQPTDNLAA